MPITKDELLKGRDKTYTSEYTQEISDNLDKLLIPLNTLRDAYGSPWYISSGWRPAEVNAATPGAATHSKHMLGLAADIKDDEDGTLAHWLKANEALLEQLGIYCEDFRWTRNPNTGIYWCHCQLGAPQSNNRIFRPSLNPPSDPNFIA